MPVVLRPLLSALFLLVPLVAQPAVGWIEIYGNRKTPVEKIRRQLGVKPGDPLPKSRGDAELRIEDIPTVFRARVEGFCCQESKVVLYVGVAERGSTAFPYRPEPEKEIALPDEIVTVYGEFAAALEQAAREGDTAEDLSAGHSLMVNLPCRRAQQRMLELAEPNEEILRQVLREAGDPEQRAIAAYVVGYVPKKRAIVDDLQFALQDPDEQVRLNASRALKALAWLADHSPKPGPDDPPALKVQATWFVEMLNSISLQDRLEATRTLLYFTDKPNPFWTAAIKDRALASLFEMAGWQYLPHALPAYLLLGRVADWDEQELQDSWSRGERDKTIAAIHKKLRR